MYGCNVCGEGGEYESLTLDCPLFKRGRLVLDAWEVGAAWCLLPGLRLSSPRFFRQRRISLRALSLGAGAAGRPATVALRGLFHSADS